MVRPLALSLGLFATLLSLTACEEPNYTPEQAAPFVAKWAASVGPEIKERAETTAASKVLGALMQQRREQERKRLTRSEAPYDVLIDDVYAARKYKPALISKGALTKRGELVRDVLLRAGDDGFKVERFRLAQVDRDLKELETLRKAYKELRSFEPGEREKGFIEGVVISKKPSKFQLSAASFDGLTEQLAKAPEGEAMRAQIKQYEELGEKIARLESDIEHILAHGITRYANQMRYTHMPELFVHPRHDDLYNDPELRERRPYKAWGPRRAGITWRHASFVAQEIAKKRGREILHNKTKAALSAILEGDAEATVKGLVPDFRYAQLRKEYVRYKKIAAAGDWGTVEPKRIRRGQTSETARQLKVRLQKEGYYPASVAKPDGIFDADLTKAIEAYQETHQMRVDGKPDRSFWRSLNVSAARRAEQILKNMKRWRETNIEHDRHKTYVMINIPDFTAEIWSKQERAMRMRIVVGNNDEREDEEQEIYTKPNRTPLLSAYIDRVIYNPYWNVTPRIREEEVLVDVRKLMEKDYKAKMLTLLGYAAEAPKPKEGVKTTVNTVAPRTASPLAATVGAPAVMPAQPATPGAPATPGVPATTPAPRVPPPRLVTGKSGEQIFDLATFNRLYTARHGQPPELETLFPYLDAETGEIDVSVTKKDHIPRWYADNGYEVISPGSKWEYVRQLNGDENSLGRVKVIFPNPHDVYLHDTPFKGLFSTTIRAYSHGCMRMHKPLTFAEWLLKNDGSYDRGTIKDKLEKIEYHPIFLKRRVPVHIVYHTVRVDDEGRANFLIDIYDRDEPKAPRKYKPKKKGRRR